MSLTFKLLSLAVRTAAKPIGNYIKRQSKEHEGFRRFAINQAQRVHRIDMRMRLGILHDPEAQQRMHEREQRAAEERKRKSEAPTVRTEDEQKRHEEQKARQAGGQGEGEGEVKKEEKKKPKIRPLSDARAIELGANFFSEAFIFAVAVGLLLAENYRSRVKASARRDDVSERLEGLEAQVDRLSSQHHLPELEALNQRLKRAREARSRTSWWNPAGWIRGSDPLDNKDDDEGVPGEVEGAGGQHDGPGSAATARPEQAQKKKVVDVVGEAGGKGATPAESRSSKQPERVDTVAAAARGR